MPASTSPRSTGRRRWPLIVGSLTGLVLLAALGYVTGGTVEQGQLLPYTDSEARRVEFFGAFDITFQIEPPSRLDAVGAAILGGLAGIALLMTLVAASGSQSLSIWFWGLLALGAAALSLDELLGGHETIGANLRFLDDIPFTNSPEDVVIGLYALPAGAYLFAFRDRIRSSRAGLWLVGAGVALYALAAALDLLDELMDEQWVELASMSALFLGFLAIALRDIGLSPGRAAANPGLTA